MLLHVLPPDPPGEPGSSPSPPPRQSRGANIPTRDELLEQISRLPGIVMLQLIPLSVAKFIQKNLEILLKAQTQKPEQVARAEGSLAGLGKALRKDPSLAKDLAGLLTEEQIASLLQQDDDAAP